jgi:hypothetical protein
VSDEGSGTRGRVPYEALLEAARVEWQFYDPAREPQRMPGLTRFRTEFKYQFTLRWDLADVPGGTLVKIRPGVPPPQIELTHTVRLPKSFDRPDRFSSSLVQHELDHVATSSHPRAVRLLVHLLTGVRRVERQVGRGERVDLERVQGWVNEELAERRLAVNALIQANYAELDKLTTHGGKPLASREDWFARLYTKANLDEHQFPFTGEALELLKSKEYRELSWPP